jgi:hypothetical protein
MDKNASTHRQRKHIHKNGRKPEKRNEDEQTTVVDVTKMFAGE